MNDLLLLVQCGNRFGTKRLTLHSPNRFHIQCGVDGPDDVGNEGASHIDFDNEAACPIPMTGSHGHRTPLRRRHSCREVIEDITSSIAPHTCNNDATLVGVFACYDRGVDSDNDPG